MDFTYIRPLLEYTVVIWDNYPGNIKDKLEQIKCETARIVTGGTKLSSINLLFRMGDFRNYSQKPYNFTF